MKISVLIPCHNEEKSIRACLRSALNQTRPPDQIVVVNDGSTDRTPQILKEFGRKIKVVNIYPATGNKSYAQEHGLKYVTGDVFVSTDADTILDKNLVEKIETDLKDERFVAVAGYVRSIRHNWLTTCRAYDYIIGQNIHKLAQSGLNFILVIPGAAGAFRTEIFKKAIGFDHDTLTEDLDFTYKLHKQGYRIKYDPKAVVYTQDPTTLKSYINQMRRWYSGGWQNLLKHFDWQLLGDPRRALELSLIYIEGVVFSILLLVLPLINIFFTAKLLLAYLLVTTIQASYATIKEKRLDLLLVPVIYLPIMYLNAAVFLEQFFKEFVFRRRNLVWFHPERIAI